MAQTYFPFDSGAGANITQIQWGQMAQCWINTGVLKNVLNELQVYADSTGMQVKTKSGQAWMKGHFYSSDTEVVLPIATADATNPRIDRIIIRVDWVADTIQLAVLQGTPAVSPTAPALTQNTSRWEISLAQVRVDANVATIASGKITDERTYAKDTPAHYGLVDGGNYSTAGALQYLPMTTFGMTKDITVSGNSLTINTAGTYQIEIDGAISGLNQNVLYELIIRVFPDGVTQGDYNHYTRGINASAGLNLDYIWAHNKITKYFQKGGYIQFLIRIGEAPRTIQEYFMNVVRVGD